jgi:hypothetical protein
MTKMFSIVALSITLCISIFAQSKNSTQADIYTKSIENMSKPDISFSDAKKAVSNSDLAYASMNMATSKTCSQRCSKTCSVSCTTTRGCSSRCKTYTEGCSGTSETTQPTKETAQPSSIQSEDQNKNITVYTTKTGTKYHNSGCRYLSKSSRSMSLTDAAKKGLEPCSKCNPPVITK